MGVEPSPFFVYMEIFLIIAVIIFAGLTIYAFATRKKNNLEIDSQTNQLKLENERLNIAKEQLKEKISNLEITNIGLYQEKEDLNLAIDDLKQQQNQLKVDLFNAEKQLDELNKNIEITKSSASAQASAQQQITKQAFESYCDSLNQAYEKVDQQYDQKITNIQNEYERNKKELDKIAATRAAAQEALLKEQEVKENKDNYCLTPSVSDLEDINALERVKRTLHKPRILSMLIWQTYWQPLAKVKFPIILQNKTRCGIYRITNLLDNKSYIGQSVDIYKRWTDHCKNGLGIDTPPGNKLYKAMQEDGLQNFAFELLIECPKEELDNKEKYFIELYQSKEYGYNGTGGNK